MSTSTLTNTVASTLSRFPMPAMWTKGSVQQRTLMMGVALAVLSNVLFGVLYAYSSFLAPLSGTQVFIWRMLAMWAKAVALSMDFSQSLESVPELMTLARCGG